MTDKSWKREERILAQMFGSHRNPNTGEHRADINAPGLSIECKKRLALPAWLKNAVQQSVRAAQSHETPIVVLSEVVQGKKPQRYVVLTLKDWLDLHG